MPISQTCIDSAVIVLFTAAVSGFLVPLILKRVDYQKAIQQKRFEANLARQQKVIDAQAAFLDTIADLLWKWRYLCIKVTYYGSDELCDRYAAAQEDYDREIWLLFHSIRTQISKSRRLVSDNAYDSLHVFYERMVSLDRDLKTIAQMDSAERPLQYLKMNDRIYTDISVQIDKSVDALARQLELDKQSTYTRGDQK